MSHMRTCATHQIYECTICFPPNLAEVAMGVAQQPPAAASDDLGVEAQARQDLLRAHQGSRRELGIARPTYDWAVNRLTALEKQMLELAAVGFTHGQIAKKIVYSEDGVKSKWASMRGKFPPRVRSSKTGMVAWALSRGWIDPLPVDLM